MKKLLNGFDYIINIMAFLAGGLLIFIMLSVCMEVFLRYFFNAPQVWITEVTECILLYITFLGSAWLLRNGGHVKIDIILNLFSSKVKTILGVVSSTIGIVVTFVLSYYGFKVTWDVFQRGIYTPTILEIPLVVILIIIPIGGLMLFLQFVREFVNNILELIKE